jgi:uncharacterized protein (TIGR02172 family)
MHQEGQANMNEVPGQPIAYGRTAEIFAWGEGQVLKLFYDWFALENIECEAQITRVIHASGLPVPAVGEIININGRHGLIYERVDGISMFKQFQHKPWKVFQYARRWAELHVDIHAITISAELPHLRQVLETNIRKANVLPENLRKRTLAALEDLPDGNQLCHGDFWPGNILMSSQGEIIIDWIHAAYGNPLADLARTTNLFLGMTQTSQVQRPFLSLGPKKSSRIMNSFFQLFCKICYPIYLNHYFSLCPGGQEEYRQWLPIVAAARLSDNIPELEKILLAQVEGNV